MFHGPIRIMKTEHRKLPCAGSTLRQRALRVPWPVWTGVGLLLANLSGAQILTNGGFESGLTSWSTRLSSGGLATFSNVATNLHSGTNALLVTVGNPGAASNAVEIVSSWFAASSSDTYVLRFWANTDNLDANLGVNLPGAAPAFPQIPFELSTNSLAAGDEHYQEYLYAFKASGKVSIAFNFQTAAKYWLDDVEVLDVTNNDGFDVPMTYLWQWGQLSYSRTNSTGWGGGDNDKSRLLPDGSVAWIFNDSYASTLDSFYSNIRGNSSLPRNCVVHQVGTNLYWLNNGANTFFVPTNAANLYWIGDSVVETNKLLVLLNENNASAITNVRMAVATLSLPGLTVDSITELSSPGTDGFGPFVKGDDGYYYIYNGAKVARVPFGGLAVNSAWTYWNGSAWVTNHLQNTAITDFQGWSVTRLGTSNYCAVYVPVLSLNIYAQFAPTPMGPWSGDIVIASVPDQGGEGIFTAYMPNICPGTDSNGIYTIGYSDNGCTESWFTKTYSDKSWYNPHFVTAPLLQLSPFTFNYAANANFGFETPSLGGGNHQYNPSGGLWTFSGATGNGSGLVANGSAFGNPNAPQGVQAAFLQKYGAISQAISGFTPGANYTISFFAAERFNNAQSWNVTVNGVVIASFNPGAGAGGYVNDMATFAATAATETVAFVGTDLATGDNTVFIDNVRITALASPPPALVAIGFTSGGRQLTVSGTGQPGSAYILEGITNLFPAMLWFPIMTNMADSLGNISFTNLPATTAQGFYRISGN
jgi:hypothetical protein